MCEKHVSWRKHAVTGLCFVKVLNLYVLGKLQTTSTSTNIDTWLSRWLVDTCHSCWHMLLRLNVTKIDTWLSRWLVDTCHSCWHMLLRPNVTKIDTWLSLNKDWQQHKDQKKKEKRTNNDLQSFTQKTRDRVTRTLLKTGGELMCSGRIGSSCFTGGTLCVTLVTNPVISVDDKWNISVVICAIAFLK
jgi:hypothetical protein